MTRATHLRIDRLQVEGRQFSPREAERLARLIAVELAKAPPPSSRRLERLALTPFASRPESHSLDRLAVQIAGEIRRSQA